MIVTRLCGGLGNQMFQYALGRRLALDHEVPLRLDLAPFATDPKRDYRLNHLRIAGSPATPEELMRAAPTTAKIPRRLPWLARLWPGGGYLIRETGFGYDSTVLGCPATAYLDGYWQSERYFASRAEEIRADFQLAEPFQPVRRVLADQIAAAGASVSVHVRRGDYASDPATLAYHGTCSPEWYGQAMARMAEGLEQSVFFVFSDDPAWARANLPPHDRMVFVDPQPDGRDFEDMHLMASCRHHITANSSFSWWGAWLNPDRVKRVIVPARWFNQGPSNTDDLIPSTWTRL